jgi:SEC-C motif-containing protein
VALAGRNDPCPCGSGRKYKRCCGYDRATERALEDKVAALEEIAALPYDSPLLLPESDAYDDWVTGLLEGEREASVEDALALLENGEAKRIVAACLDIHRADWRELVHRSGTEHNAVAALLAGAVAAGIRDHHPPPRRLIEIVEASKTTPEAPLETLGTCLDGSQLWSDEDGLEAARAVDAIPEWVDDDEHERRWYAALEIVAARRSTDWHRRRLARLVRRVERQLPFARLPRASAAVAAGCAEFAADEHARRRLAAMLLSDVIAWHPSQTMHAPLFAA